MRRLSPALLAVAAAAFAGSGRAQPRGVLLHRPIPGDLPLGETEGRGGLTPPAPIAAVQGAAAATGWSGQQAVDPTVTQPRSSWEAPVRQLDRQTRSAPGTELGYREVFTPAIAPFKRLQAYDELDELGRLTVRDPALHPLVVGGAAPSTWQRQRRARFVGELLVAVSPTAPTPIPSVAGEQRVVEYTTSDGQPLEFAHDSAGNLFVRGMVSATVRLTYVLEVPESSLQAARVPSLPLAQAAAAVPAELRPRVPSWLPPRAEAVLQALHVSRADRFDTVLARLVEHFRRFRDAELSGPEQEDLYSTLALGGVGACRHRAYALLPTLHVLGIPARYVGNEAHAWVEVFLPGAGWTRIDLGGWDVPLRAEAATERPSFQPSNPDPFPRPPEYSSQYSAQLTGGLGGGSAREDGGQASSGSGGASGSGGSGAGAGGTRGGGTGGGSGTGARGAVSGREVEADEEEGEALVRTVLTVSAVQADESAGYRSAQGFVRGSMVRIEGDVREQGRLGVGGLAVDVELVRGHRVITALGTTVSQPDGRWETRVLLPAGLEAGEYTVRASTPGDARHAPSTGE